MIVRSDDEQLLLITQPDHAHLAARIMERCVSLRAHPRRREVLRAVADHDGGWAVLDASPTILPESGRVADFINAPTPLRQSVWPRGVALLGSEPWAAALVAQHALTIYARFRTDEAWQPFFATMTHLRDRMVANATGSLQDLEADYTYVRLADLISLAFCTGSRDLSQFGEWTVTPDGDRVVVWPDPFGGVDVPVEIRARQLPAREFSSDEELRAALAGATAITLRGVITASSATIA
jgi:hypothetical protein